MFGNAALDVAIGLIFIFLLYSLLASIILEIIAKMFGLRARNLLRALRRMLQDEPQTKNRLTVLAWFKEYLRDIVYYFKPLGSKNSLLSEFYNYPTIKFLGENSVRSKPSYIYPATFSQTIIQLLRRDIYNSQAQSESKIIHDALSNDLLNIGKENPETLKQLKALFEDARQDSLQFRILLERWYDEMMQVSAAWYQRQSQILLIFIGLTLAISFNIDTIAIAKILIKDKNAREQLVQLAINQQDKYGQIIDQLRAGEAGKNTTLARLDSLVKRDLALKDTLQNDGLLVQNILGLGDSKKTIIWKTIWIIPYPSFEPLPLLGWIITALAVSLGAPFWFDLLNKLIAVRKVTRNEDNGIATTTSQTPELKIVG